jgi:chromosome segregation ATPase
MVAALRLNVQSLEINIQNDSKLIKNLTSMIEQGKINLESIRQKAESTEDSLRMELEEANGQINTQQSNLAELKMKLDEKDHFNTTLSSKIEQIEEKLQQTVDIYEKELK